MAGDTFMKLPIVRGWDGTGGKDWMIVGTGRKLKAVRSKKERLAVGTTNVKEEW